MKPTSWIFILISLIIILVGWIVCNSAESAAAAEGIPIFDSAVDVNKNLVSKLNFAPDEIYNKIDFVVDSADIYINGGYAEPYIELINFQDGSYRNTMGNRSITVDTTIDLSSIIRFWESGFSFRGLRNYLHRTDSGGAAAKRINVYLPSDGDINIINITLESGNVYVSNFDTSIDVNVKIGEGDATFTSFSTTSSVDAEISSGNLYFRDAAVGELEVLMPKGDITAESLEFDDINISGNETNVSLKIVPEMADFNMNLSARHGEITLFGERCGKEYAHEAGLTKRAMITVSSGSIVIEHGASRAPEAPDTGSGTGTAG